MRKSLTSLFIVFSAIGTANAAPPETTKQSFKHEGYTYVYEVAKDARSETITGIRYPDGTPFTLTVRGGRVEGVSNGQPVTFSLSDARGAAKGAVSQ